MEESAPHLVEPSAAAPDEQVPKQPRGLKRFALRHPRASAWVVLILILGLWGSWAGPGWNPQPMRTLIVPETSDTEIATSSPTASIGTYEVTESVISITLTDGTEIPATLRVPEGVEGLVPGMVFIHGTGTDSYKSFATEATDISSTGVITIVPEKRTSDYTTTHRDYVALAADYSDVFGYLVTSVAGVDPHRSGVYGVSEGCFIAPIVATDRSDVSFVTLVSAPVLSIREQGALAADTYLRNLGAPERLIRAIPRLIGQDFGEDTFDYIDFDVSTYQQKMTMPVLMLYGTADMSMPTVQGPLIMREDLAHVGNSDLTVRYYDGADHGLKVDHVLVEQAMQDTADWVNGLPATADASPHIAGAQPSQNYVAGSVGRPHWFASGSLAIWILIIGMAVTVISLLITVCNVIIIPKKHRMDFHGCGPKITLASLGIIVAWGVCFGYVLAIADLAVTYQQNQIIVQGGWLLSQTVALIAAWLVVRVAFSWYSACRGQDRITWLLRVFLTITLVGELTLIFALAYWGFYPSII